MLLNVRDNVPALILRRYPRYALRSHRFSSLRFLLRLLQAPYALSVVPFPSANFPFLNSVSDSVLATLKPLAYKLDAVGPHESAIAFLLIVPICSLVVTTICPHELALAVKQVASPHALI